MIISGIPFLLTSETILTSDTVMSDYRTIGSIKKGSRSIDKVLLQGKTVWTGSDPIQTLVDEYVANVALTSGDTVESTAPYTAIYNELSRLDSSGEWAADNSWSILKEGGLKKDGSNLVSYVYPLKKVSGSWVKTVQPASTRYPVHTANGFFDSADTRRYLKIDSINFAKDNFEVGFRANLAGTTNAQFFSLSHSTTEADVTLICRQAGGFINLLLYSDAAVLETNTNFDAYPIIDSVLDFKITFERTTGTTVTLKLYVGGGLIQTRADLPWTGTADNLRVGNATGGGQGAFKLLEYFNIKKI